MRWRVPDAETKDRKANRDTREGREAVEEPARRGVEVIRRVIEVLHAPAPGIYSGTLPYFSVPDQNRVAHDWSETDARLRRATLAGGATHALLRRHS